MSGLSLIALLGLSIMAILSAKGIKWKLLNIIIILGCAAAVVGIGAAVGAWGGNMKIGGLVAMPLAICLGAVGAFGCWWRNKMQEKKSPEVQAAERSA
jgi:hypothetical protein